MELTPPSSDLAQASGREEEPPLTDEERYPLLTEAGARMLERLRHHPHGPRFNHVCGDRLDAEALRRVRDFAERLRTGRTGWCWNEPPEWVEAFTQRCLERVPFYRRYGVPVWPLDCLPTCTRADLGEAPWDFVPDDEPLDGLIVYTTSGTTGHQLLLPSHPEAASKYLPLLEAALATRGLTLDRGPDKVALIQVCAQKQTWTFGNVTSYLDQAGFAKVNLDPDAWSHPDDRIRFLDDCAPGVYTGDPVAFQELAKLPLTTRPRALLSSATALLHGVREALEGRFGCPVIDIYSMKESAPIAVEMGRGYEILPHDLYVEVLDRDGRLCVPGERGEVTLTGGRNPYLPLLRYRTGDWASMDFSGPIPVLVELEGRPPVVFRSAAGVPVNSIDVTWALRGLCLTRFTLHQDGDGLLCFSTVRGPAEVDIHAALLSLFGAEQPLRVDWMPDEDAWAGKVVQYTTDLAL